MLTPLLRRYTWNSAWLYNIRIFIALCGTTALLRRKISSPFAVKSAIIDIYPIYAFIAGPAPRG